MDLGGGGGKGAAAGEDRLSALPDDLLVLILRKLSTDEAAQTSVLSHRWRNIWALLPVLRFFKAPEPHRLREVLDAHNVLLDELLVQANGATPETLAVWLPAAARRVSGHLGLLACPVEDAEDYDSEEEEEEAAHRGAFEFPCFDKATKIVFSLCHLGLAVPVTGVFARLTELHLRYVWFHGPGELGDAVSSQRSPCLQRLNIEHARGLRDLAIHSESVLWMKLSILCTLSQLIIVAQGLKELIVEGCFLKSEPIVNISAPLLTKLEWDDQYGPSYVLGEMENIQWLRTGCYLVYEEEMAGFVYNQSILSLLQRFNGIKSLVLPLMYHEDIEDYDYLMEEMAVLPDITFLCLMVLANGHAFGASAFHVLRLCTGIRRLKLELAKNESEAQDVCSSGCICVQLVDWETEELLLNHLEEVEINGFTGTKHEVAFVKQLFGWGAKLKEVTINFHGSIFEVKTKELYQTFQSFSRPEVCMKFYRDENNRKVLYAPKD